MAVLTSGDRVSHRGTRILSPRVGLNHVGLSTSLIDTSYAMISGFLSSGDRTASLLKASPKGEVFQPSPSETLRMPRATGSFRCPYAALHWAVSFNIPGRESRLRAGDGYLELCHQVDVGSLVRDAGVADPIRQIAPDDPGYTEAMADGFLRAVGASAPERRRFSGPARKSIFTNREPPRGLAN